MDLWHKFLTWADYNRGAIIAVVLTVAVGAGLIGCQPKTASILQPDRQVTPAELNQEVMVATAQIEQRQAILQSDAATLQARAAAAQADIEAQLALRRTVIETLGGLGTALAEGTVNPASAIGSVVSLALLFSAGGLLYDNRRKDKIIASASESAPASP